MGETRILPTHDKRNPLVLIPDPLDSKAIPLRNQIASKSSGSGIMKKSPKPQASSPKRQASSGCDILSRVNIFLDTNCDNLALDFYPHIIYNI